jgi:hypothetical protein
MILCHGASLTPPAATGSNYPSTKKIDLNLNNSVRAAVLDIKDNRFWKCIYMLQHAVFPALRLLCYCDKSKPAMD